MNGYEVSTYVDTSPSRIFISRPPQYSLQPLGWETTQFTGTIHGPGPTTQTEKSGPYGWLFDPPRGGGPVTYRMDYVRLLIQWALLVVVAVGGFLYFKFNPPSASPVSS